MEISRIKFVLVICVVTVHLMEMVDCRDAVPIIIPDQGTIMGTYIKMYRTQNIIGYLGIPYAVAQRFEAPDLDQLPTWQGIRNASFYQPDCWQNPKIPIKRHNEIFANLLKTVHPVDENKRYDEDCLFVNVYIPDGPPPMEGYAVIAWLHSGDFSYGSPNDLDPFQLVFKQKVIVVTIAYRLNIFGFMTTADGEAPGNFGLLDQAAALLWIKRNIKLFGGNENSITLMGHGSGAISVGLHLTSGDWSTGVFHRAIIMSGSFLADESVLQPSEFAPAIDSFYHLFGCNRRPTSKLIECLRRVDAKILSTNIPSIRWSPVVDRDLSNTTTPFVQDHPKKMVERGMIRDVPLMIGYTDMEDVLDVIVGDMVETGITNEIYDTMLTDIILTELSSLETNETMCGNVQMVVDGVKYAYMPYPPIKDGDKLRKMLVNFYTDRKYIAPSIQLANFMSKFNMTYMYRFDIKPKTEMAKKDLSEWVGVPHNFDLIFVWGMPYWTNKDGYNQWDSTDKRITDIVMTLWTNFAKFSDPTKTGVYIAWDKYTADEQKILVVDRAFNMTDDMNFRGIQFWNDYFPRIVTHARNCCNGTESGAVATQLHTTNNLWLISAAFVCLKTAFIRHQFKMFT